MKRPVKIPTSITLDPEVLEYLQEKRVETGLTRSWIINAVIRDRMKREKEKTAYPLDPNQMVLKDL